MSEIIVGATALTAPEIGLSNFLVGGFEIAIVGNAAERATQSVGQ
jgi:hypothetical protein